MPLRIAIIGAGPIGLEAAVAALDRGYEVSVYEKGRPGEAVRQWGHVRMFSPFGMNASAAGLRRLQALGVIPPPAESLLTGREYVDAYLQPLADSLGIFCLHTGVEVVAIGRDGVRKGDKIGSPERGATPFRLLVSRSSHPHPPVEWIVKADIVLDCSGTYFNPNPAGDGGIPAGGERACRDRVITGVPDVRSRHRAHVDRRSVMVVGGGHTAATVVCELADIHKDHPEAAIIWAVRKELSEPCRRIPDDPLPERDRLCAAANALVRSGRVDFRPAATVQAIDRTADGLCVTVARGGSSEQVFVDRLIACCGFRPDLNLARELQVQTCWATEGTYKLAAALLGESAGDCLAVPGFGPEMLAHPEPGYFALGMKSYGRAPDFLIRTGLEQITGLMNWLEKIR